MARSEDDDLLDDLLAGDSDDESPSCSPPSQSSLLKVAPLRRSPRKSLKSVVLPKTSGELGVSKRASTTISASFKDDFFKIDISEATVNQSALNSLCDGMEKVSVMARRVVPEGAWLSMGVLTEKSATLRSANGNEYLMLRLHDLRNCSEKARKVLVFGDAVKSHWKLRVGSVLLLLSPQVSIQADDPEKALKVSKPTQVLFLGTSSDFAKCKGRKTDGSPCGNIVNKTNCEVCVFHAGAEARRLAARRGAFSQATAPLPKNVLNAALPKTPRHSFKKVEITTPSLESHSPSSLKKVKAEEKEKLKLVLETQVHSFGARNLKQLREGGGQRGVEGEQAKSQLEKQTSSMRTFIDARNKPPFRSIKEEAAINRALAILSSKKLECPKPVKRKAQDQSDSKEQAPSAGRERVLALLAKKTMHDHEAEEVEREMEKDHLDSLEKREQVEGVLSACTELKDIRVFSCKECGYTARSRSERCLRLGHSTKTHLAAKRFFRCQSCSTRTFAYGKLPTKPCVSCNGREWRRVAMCDERKVVLDNEKLQLRGEERQFINS